MTYEVTLFSQDDITMMMQVGLLLLYGSIAALPGRGRERHHPPLSRACASAQDKTMTSMLTIHAVQDIRRRGEDFMIFWSQLNERLTELGAQEALFGDARYAFYHYKQTVTEAADHVMRMRSEIGR